MNLGGPGSENESCTSCHRRQDQQARSQEEIWSEHLIGTPLGVIKARAATALPDGHRCEANAIDDMQGTPWQLSATSGNQQAEHKKQTRKTRAMRRRKSPKKSGWKYKAKKTQVRQ